MSQRKTLITITYHTDDDTGMYHIGEIDFGIGCELEEYLIRFGDSGKKDIISALGYLIYEVEKSFREHPGRDENKAVAECNKEKRT